MRRNELAVNGIARSAALRGQTRRTRVLRTNADSDSADSTAPRRTRDGPLFRSFPSTLLHVFRPPFADPAVDVVLSWRRASLRVHGDLNPRKPSLSAALDALIPQWTLLTRATDREPALLARMPDRSLLPTRHLARPARTVAGLFTLPELLRSARISNARRLRR